MEDVDPRNIINELNSKEWVKETVSVWTQKGLGSSHPDTKIEKQHPAPFSFHDVGRLIRFFTKTDNIVLDPFVGIGSTLKACAINKRYGIGFELNEKYVKLTKSRLDTEIEDNEYIKNQKIIKGDARNLINALDNDSIDFIVTSPPYWNILHKIDHKIKQNRISKGLDSKYSNDENDFGNINSYLTFLEDISKFFNSCARPLKNKKYMSIIVSDFRNKSEYITFHSDLIQKMGNLPFMLKGIKILYQRHKNVFPYGYPYSYVPNIHHHQDMEIQILEVI